MAESDNILDILKKDERYAFHLLFERYYDNLLLYCFHISGDLEVAEDIVQDCFVYLWNSKRLNSFSGELERFIFKIVKNRSLLFLKEHKKRNEGHRIASEEIPADCCAAAEEDRSEVELLYNTIDRLPEKCRQVFLTACLSNKTYQQVADELGTSVNTVKTQMKTALRFLRENLQKEHFVELFFLWMKGVR